MPITSYRDKVAAITGAGSGMGRALAVLLSREGCHLALSDVNETGLEETLDLLDPSVKSTIRLVDVADRSDMESFARTTVADHGSVNMIFNNAGVSVTGLSEQMSLEDFEWLMDINFWGVVHGCRSFMPYLHEVDEAAIINTSSMFGIIALPTQSAYNASKFAVRGYTYSLRQELKETNIGVSCVQPGGVKTNIVRSSRFVPWDNETASFDDMSARFDEVARLTSEEAANVILNGVRKNKAQILVGTDAKVVALLERLMPTGYMSFTGKLLKD